MYVGSNEIITFLDNLFLCSWRPIMPSVYRHRERALNCGMHSLSFVNNWSTRPEAGLQWGGGGGGGRWTGWTGVLRGRWGEEEGWENNSLLSAGVPGKEQVRRYPLHCFYSVYLTPVHRGEVRRRRGRGRGRRGTHSPKYQKRTYVGKSHWSNSFSQFWHISSGACDTEYRSQISSHCVDVIRILLMRDNNARSGRYEQR